MGTRIADAMKSGFFKGVGLGAGLLAASLFAAAAAMNVFSPGQAISSAAINRNFAIAAPEGAIMAFYLSACPDGWATADGTNGTPDLRGMFIRGRDDAGTGAAGQDPGGSRAIGHLQQDAFQGHWHSVSFPNAYVDGTGAPNGSRYAGTGGGGEAGEILTSATATTLVTDGTNGAPRTAIETRPKNVALTYCMRKN